jgi:hypothetical protein
LAAAGEATARKAIRAMRVVRMAVVLRWDKGIWTRAV